MLQQWQRKRWFVFCLQTFSFISTGAMTYTVGSGGNFNTGSAPFNNQFNYQFLGGAGESTGSARPARLEYAFLRQLQPSAPSPVDYPLVLLPSMEDYNGIALKSMVSFPEYAYYQPTWPLGTLYVYPVALPNIYEIFISVMAQLPQSFAISSQAFSIPYEYYRAIVTNLAMEIRPLHGIVSFQGDSLPNQAKDALNVLKTNNFAMGLLKMPLELRGAGNRYNIFSDRNY
jgi:hypothetical protein